MKNLLLCLSAICIALAVDAQQYIIKAHVTGFPDGTKFFLEDVNADANIDSAVIQNGHFELKGKLDETPQSLWLLCNIGNKFYYTTLLMGNDNLNITGDAKDFPFDLSIIGSKTQDEHNLLMNLTKNDWKERNELVEQYIALKGTDSAEIKSKRIWKAIGKIDSSNTVITKQFILSHLNTYEGLSNLFYIKEQFSADTLQQMYNSLKPEFKLSSFGARINNYLKVGKILEKGDHFADFEAVDMSGQKHKLSAVKGKYILLDFSTTYCGPCIESVEDLKILKKKYAGQLEIISFSADGGKATWLKGINRDNPEWLSLWDGKGNYGETILKYGVTGYPSFFFIDQQGKIIDRWAGYGKDPGKKGSLETKVDALLTKQAN